MLNRTYQLVSPRVIALNIQELNFDGRVIVRPRMMSLCAADHRYFQGRRPQEVLDKKLPMALVHEAMGEVIYSPTPELPEGTPVAMIPNQIPVASNNPQFYENYATDSYFLSSGYDGFMQEMVALPLDRVVDCRGIDYRYITLSELLSVGCHAVSRMKLLAHQRRESFGVWGDGPVGYLTALVLRANYPEAQITVVGRHNEKLSYFTFADNTYLSAKLPADFRVDHAFECTGGEGSAVAINQIISHARPQACLVLMGVSEEKPAICTRDILEKGMTVVGSSRSGRKDFESAREIISQNEFTRYLDPIMHLDEPVTSVSDINRVFSTDLTTPFKTVFEWRI